MCLWFNRWLDRECERVGERKRESVWLKYRERVCVDERERERGGERERESEKDSATFQSFELKLELKFQR